MKTNIILLLLVCALLSSCSIVGYNFGSGFDRRSAHDSAAIFSDIDRYNGQGVRILFKDTTVCYATFVGIAEEPDSSYCARYNAYQTGNVQNPAAIRFDDSAVIIHTMSFDGKKEIDRIKGRFQGYHPYGVFLGEEKFFFRSESFSGVDTLSSSDYQKRFSKAVLQSMLKANAVPVRSRLNFKDSTRVFSLTNSDFQNVVVLPHRGISRWIWAGIGAAIDIAIIIWVVPNLSETRSSGFHGLRF